MTLNIKIAKFKCLQYDLRAVSSNLMLVKVSHYKVPPIKFFILYPLGVHMANYATLMYCPLPIPNFMTLSYSIEAPFGCIRSIHLSTWVMYYEAIPLHTY